MDPMGREIVLLALLAVSWAVLTGTVVVLLWRAWMRPDAPPVPLADATRAAVAHPPASAPVRSTTSPTVTLRLMCEHERDQHAHVQIPATTRRPTFTHGGQHYVASRRDARGDWIYRWTRKE